MLDTGTERMRVWNFEKFVNESKGLTQNIKKRAAGVAVVYEGKILLVHPTGASWQRSTCGIPKGGMEEGEDPMDAAIRELFEETGINITSDQLDPDPNSIYSYNKKGIPSWEMIYYLATIDDLSEVGLESEKIPKTQLQLEEVDWAKFVDLDEAYSIVNRAQLIILDRLKNKMK